MVNERDYTLLFSRLFELHYKNMYVYAASYVRDQEVAGDITHDVFVVVWQNRAKIDFQQPMAPYLTSLVRNHCLNYLARQRVEHRYEQHQQRHAEMYDLFRANDEEPLLERIIQRIDTLPERCSEVMRLCFLECKKYKEIATLLQISVNTVKEHISKGLKILREEFPEELVLLFCFLHHKESEFAGLDLKD